MAADGGTGGRHHVAPVDPVKVPGTVHVDEFDGSRGDSRCVIDVVGVDIPVG
jgi:hypothetical protein